MIKLPAFGMRMMHRVACFYEDCLVLGELNKMLEYPNSVVAFSWSISGACSLKCALWLLAQVGIE